MTDRSHRGDATPDDVVRAAIVAERRDALRGPDGPEGRALGAAIGTNVRRERERIGLALDALAARSGVAPDILARLEDGRAVPSLRVVWSLATALGVPFAHLLVQQEGAVFFRVQRAREGRTVISGTGDLRSRLLSPPGLVPELYELAFRPGAVEAAEPHAPGTVEHLVVLRGGLILHADDAMARLEAGDAVFFQADRPHTYHNPTAAETVVHCVMAYASHAARRPDGGRP
ncbi:MAG: helix-turn-helix domain-containing protein [bacterium]|nr:helix-turn-helix domain-containing protein [bacterium]